MAVNSGLPKRVSYTAYNVSTQQFVAGDQANHTLELILDGVSLGVPDNLPPASLGYGVYSIALSEAERSGSDLVLIGESSTPDVILQQTQFSSDARWDELLELDDVDLRGTAKYLELAPDSIADISGLALQSTLLAVKAVTDKIPFNADEIIVVDVQWWQGVQISGVNMIEDPEGEPRWTVRALSNAPTVDNVTVAYVSQAMETPDGYLEILRGDTFHHAILLNVALANVDEIIFAIKRETSDADSDSLLFISSVNGLEYINGEAAGSPANGRVSVGSVDAGLIIVNCSAEEMAKLPENCRGTISEVQLYTAVPESIYTCWRRKSSIVGDIVRETS